MCSVDVALTGYIGIQQEVREWESELTTTTTVHNYTMRVLIYIYTALCRPRIALYKLKKNPLSSHNPLNFPIVSLSFSYNCSNDTDSENPKIQFCDMEVTLLHFMCVCIYAMMIIIKYYIKLVLSCSRHQRDGYALYQCTTLGLHNTYFSLLFTYSQPLIHPHIALSSRFSTLTHTPTNIKRGAYENIKQEQLVVQYYDDDVQLHCNYTTLPVSDSLSRWRKKGKTTDVLWICASSTIIKTCVYDFKVFSACTRFSLSRKNYTKKRAWERKKLEAPKIIQCKEKFSLSLSKIKYSENHSKLVLDWTSRGDYVHTP